MQDLKLLLRALGFEAKKDEIEKLSAELDGNKSGLIDLEKFKEVITPRIAARDPEEEMHNAFVLFAEREGSNGITL